MHSRRAEIPCADFEFERFGGRPFCSTFDLLVDDAMAVVFLVDFHQFRQSKIGYLGNVLIGDQHVACGNVSMDDTIIFQVDQTFTHIPRSPDRVQMT